MGKWLMYLPPLLFAGLAVMFYVGMQRSDPENLPSVFINKQAPALNAGVLPGFPALTDADLRDGKVTVVNFWASWCPPCRAENGTLKALAAEGIHVVGVNMMDRADDAAAFLADDGNPFAAIAFDPKGKTRLDWGVTAPPETFILRGDGSVAYKFIGPMVGDDYLQRFRPELEKALAE
ncbi:MAG: DsbE family thiol:disulfide interchange protein [Cypionkella sp.]|uniref:DsbE family thiol:disulfide interchange protein n=1 Tax=Cypionkella sp. TaxID=2811411 RepID=UPI002624E0FA|nr:DsbE family thiol:disulfide interchange protein [Cypionkella sp.]MDB5660663.1 DsbE family thiol:disulfide interchange protein [Cypionkella sp.]